MKSKQMKQEEADARNTYWASLPIDMKVAILKLRPGQCKKQLNKLGA